MGDWELRARRLVGANLAVVVALLVVLALLGGWLTYDAHAGPETEQREEVVSSWETTAAFDHGATVTRENPVYDVGTRLDNRSVYFTNVAPVMNGSFDYGYTATGEGELDVDAETELVIRSVESPGEADTTVYWQQRRDRTSANASGLEPGESVSVPFSVDLAAAANETADIDEQLGGSPGQSEVVVEATVTLSGTVDGEAVERTERYTLPVELGETAAVDATGPTTERYERTETVRDPVDSSPLQAAGGPLLLLGSVLVLGGVGAMASRDELGLSSTERASLAHRRERAEFDDWITRIRLPESVLARERAHAESLADLVDFAIDTDNAVVESPDASAYYVVHDDLLYVYEPPER
ncbi:DUF5305 domain-containing protein [Halomarina ordinaria]|uniref:DUF5305 domain-containing protein n=1 Tax=Halomarina ordinaria TaxID=3033939 RepID=A0ABD5U6J3_9EURY|nr:DUF5305 domain-containing protein [Halomarina sp. PSRA2]